MNLKQLNPWNWFKNEEESSHSVPVQRMDSYHHPLMQFHQDIDNMFDRFFRSFGFPSQISDSILSAPDGLLKPSVDIAETEKEYTISVEAPGVDKDGIHVSLDDGTLTIRGEKKKEKEEKEKNYHRIERSFGSFQRTLSLPTDADGEKIEANYKNGVLTLKLPKIPGAKLSVKTIPIK